MLCQAFILPLQKKVRPWSAPYPAGNLLHSLISVSFHRSAINGLLGDIKLPQGFDLLLKNSYPCAIFPSSNVSHSEESMTLQV